MGTRVIGNGQRAAGDDGVGPAVVRHLRDAGVPEDIELIEAAEPSAIIPLLSDVDTVVLVDAAVEAGPPGSILRLTPDSLQSSGFRSLSSHGFGVAQAIEMARALSPDSIAATIVLVAISIEPPKTPGDGLSPGVASAVPRAAAEVLRIAEESRCTAVRR
jgi:hydrogenase maturation protease